MFPVMQGGRLSHIFTFCCSNFVGLFDTGDQSHNTVYTLHHFMFGIYCMTVSQSCKGKWVPKQGVLTNSAKTEVPGILNKFYTGRLHPEVQPLSLLLLLTENIPLR